MENTMQDILNKPLIKVREYAKFTSQSPFSVWRDIRHGKLPAVKLPSGAIRIPNSVVRGIFASAGQEEKGHTEAQLLV
jgi:predicted DNA-binding transcriptional regulator AlpA